MRILINIILSPNLGYASLIPYFNKAMINSGFRPTYRYISFKPDFLFKEYSGIELQEFFGIEGPEIIFCGLGCRRVEMANIVWTDRIWAHTYKFCLRFFGRNFLSVVYKFISTNKIWLHDEFIVTDKYEINKPYFNKLIFGRRNKFIFIDHAVEPDCSYTFGTKKDLESVESFLSERACLAFDLTPRVCDRSFSKAITYYNTGSIKHLNLRCACDLPDMRNKGISGYSPKKKVWIFFSRNISSYISESFKEKAVCFIARQCVRYGVYLLIKLHPKERDEQWWDRVCAQFPRELSWDFCQEQPDGLVKNFEVELGLMMYSSLCVDLAIRGIPSLEVLDLTDSSLVLSNHDLYDGVVPVLNFRYKGWVHGLPALTDENFDSFFRQRMRLLEKSMEVINEDLVLFNSEEWDRFLGEVGFCGR